MSKPSRSDRTDVRPSNDAVASPRRPPPRVADHRPGDEAAKTAPRASSQSTRSGSSTSEPYEVGYGKPPKSTQFQPGKSGNPRGRPKESLSLKTIAQRELKQMIEIRDGDGTRKITKREAMIKSLLMKGLKGDLNSIKALIVIAGEDSEPERIVQDEPLSPADEAQLRRLLGDAALAMPIGTRDKNAKG